MSCSVVEQPLTVELSLPGELTAYQTVGHLSAGHRIREDRSAWTAGRAFAPAIAAGDARSAGARGAAGRGAVEAAGRGSAARGGARKSRCRPSTFDKLRAASATPGVVAGNDVVVAEKAADASREPGRSRPQQNVEAARQALNAVREMEGYLRVTAPFDGVVTERNVHPGALVGPASGAGARRRCCVWSTTIVCGWSCPFRKRTRPSCRTGVEIPFSVAAYPGQSFTGTMARDRAGRRCEHADDGGGTGRGQPRRSTRAGNVLPGALAGPPAGAVALRAERQRRDDDRSHVRRFASGAARPSGWTSGPGSPPDHWWRSSAICKAGDEIARRGTDELRAGTEVRSRSAKGAASEPSSAFEQSVRCRRFALA